MSEMMSHYLAFIALMQHEGNKMCLIAVEDLFAELEGFDAEQRRRLTFIARTYLEHEWAGARGDVSLLEYEKARHFAGHDRVFPDGYAQLIEALAGDADVRLGHEVRQVDYSGGVVDVLTDQGSFQAHHVLVTVLLGVLRAGKIAFNPSLPRAKRRAIRNTHRGVSNKVLLKFDAVFWDRDYDLIDYMGSTDCGWLEIVDFHKIAKLPLLLAFSAGTAGEKNELRSDTELVADLMACLRKIYGADVPEPSGYLVTRMSQDAESLGSYSYVPVGSNHSKATDRRAGRRPDILRG